MKLQTLIDANVCRCIEDFKQSLDSWSLLEWGGACAGEVGEACNVAKKLIRIRDGFEKFNKGATEEELKKNLGKEIADTIHYAILWSAAAGLDIEQDLIDTFNDVSIRVGSTRRLTKDI